MPAVVCGEIGRCARDSDKKRQNRSWLIRALLTPMEVGMLSVLMLCVIPIAQRSWFDVANG